MISYYTHSPELMIVVAGAGHEVARAKPGRDLMIVVAVAGHEVARAKPGRVEQCS